MGWIGRCRGVPCAGVERLIQFARHKMTHRMLTMQGIGRWLIMRKGEETTPHANEWEVVSLTASTYAAAPGPVQVKPNNDDESNVVEADEAQTSKAMLMSGHFAIPEKEHEKTWMEPESIEISSIMESTETISDLTTDDGGISKKKGDENWDGIQFYNEKDNSLSFADVKFKEETTFEELNLIEKGISLYKSEPTVSVEEIVGPEQVEAAEGECDLGISQLSIPNEEDVNNGSGYPYEAWWKKHATALYAQAKEANAFWSIFVAATVMGFVILGQHWRLERWQVLQLRWQSSHFSINNEKMGWMLAPLSRIKDVLVGGDRRGSLTRGSSLADN